VSSAFQRPPISPWRSATSARLPPRSQARSRCWATWVRGCLSAGSRGARRHTPSKRAISILGTLNLIEAIRTSSDRSHLLTISTGTPRDFLQKIAFWHRSASAASSDNGVSATSTRWRATAALASTGHGLEDNFPAVRDGDTDRHRLGALWSVTLASTTQGCAAYRTATGLASRGDHVPSWHRKPWFVRCTIVPTLANVNVPWTSSLFRGPSPIHSVSPYWRDDRKRSTLAFIESLPIQRRCHHDRLYTEF